MATPDAIRFPLLFGLAADIPAAASVEAGQVYYSTDTGAYQVSSGAAWSIHAIAGAAPAAHATSHENGGGDEINVGGLSGLLADAQTPTAHATSHKSDGSDPIATPTPRYGGTVHVGGAIAGTAVVVTASEDDVYYSRVDVDKIKGAGATFTAAFVVRGSRTTGSATITIRLRDTTNATILGTITYTNEAAATTKEVSITLPASGKIDIKATVQGSATGSRFEFDFAGVEFNNA